MNDALRRIYNTVDLLFDSRSFSQELRFSHAGGETKRPKTALQALNSIYPFARDLDRQARLKLIVSQQGINADGASPHWEFFLDLTQRRAHLICEWALSWNEEMDDYGPSSVEIAVKPFPSVDSPIRQLVTSGKLLHRQMVSMWKQECARLPGLPHKFRDTDAVLAEFVQQGLDVSQNEFSLRTGQSPEGYIRWIAQTRNATYYAAFV